jgi:hypothetical protein
MNILITTACFLAAVLVTLFRGAGSALAFVYLPALLLLWRLEGIYIPGLPDPTPPTACIYGILIAGLLRGLLRGSWPRLRPSPVDYIVASLMLAYIISGVLTERLYTGVAVFGSMGLNYVVPYFIVRCTFEQERTQRYALLMLVAAISIIGFFAFIELRLWPHYYLIQLENLGIDIGLTDIGETRARRRFGLFRANVSFDHPIGLGIGAAQVLAAIFILANRSGVGTKNVWVRVGLGMALVATLASASFTPYTGLAGAFCLYLVLSTVPSASRFLVSGVAIVIAVGYAYTAHVASAPMPERPVDASAFENSRWVRHLIIKESWQAATTAGAFGWGRSIDKGELVDLKSMDNAYMLIALERGWVGIGLWLALPLCLAVTVSRALRRVQPRHVRRSIRAGFCACIGTMISLYTVWFGNIYSCLLMVMIALTVNAAQAAMPARRAYRRSPPGGRSVPRTRAGQSVTPIPRRAAPWRSPTG